MASHGICVITHPLSSAGENATRTLLEILASLGPVCLVTADLPKDSSIRDRYETIELTEEGAGKTISTSAARFVLNQLRMCNTIYQRPEEVVLFFGATSYLLPILFAKLFGKTVIVEPRGDVPLTLRLNWERQMPNLIAKLLAGAVRTLERLGYITADRVVTYTPSMAQQLGLNPKSEKVFPDGARYVDTKEFSVRTPFEQRDKIVGFVGRIDEEKGIRTLAKVAKHLPEEISVRIIGDGPLFGWLQSELADEIAADQVHLTGWVDHGQVTQELNKLQLLIVPSQPTEGLPTIILESFSCGTPVYATPVAGVPDVIEEGQTGYFLTEETSQEIARKITQTLENEDLAQVSEKVRDCVCNHYSFTAAVDRYRTLFEDLGLID